MMERWELPKGWEWRRLGDICKTTSGGTPKRNVAGYYGGTIPWLKSGELDDGLILRTEETITEKGLNESNAKIFPKGTLLIALYGATVGKLGILGIDAATNQAICAIFPSHNVENTFLFWFLRAIRQKLLKSSFGGAQPNISQEIIRNLEVPIPYPDDPARSLAEQRRIVARLELLLGETRAMRDDIDAMRRDLAQVMESALAEVFPNPNGEMPKGWGWKSIDDLFELQQGASMSPRRRQGRNPQPFLRTKNILWGEVDTSDVDVMDFTEDEIERLKLRKGDLLICEGGDVGRAAVWEDQLPLVMYQNHIHRLRRKSDDADPKFYVYWMKAAYQLFKIYQGEESRTAIPNLSGRRLKNFLVPTTSLTEQRRIVAYLEHIAEEIRAMDDLLAQDLRSLEALEQSILAAAFRGEV